MMTTNRVSTTTAETALHASNDNTIIRSTTRSIHVCSSCKWKQDDCEKDNDKGVVIIQREHDYEYEYEYEYENQLEYEQQNPTRKRRQPVRSHSCDFDTRSSNSIINATTSFLQTVLLTTTTTKRRRSMSVFSHNTLLFVFVLIISFHQVSISSATLYIPNYLGTSTTSASASASTSTTGTNSTSSSSSSSSTMLPYETLPALFGRYMVDDRLYVARVQYWPENPYLCSIEPHSSFRRSIGITLPSPSSTQHKSQSNRNHPTTTGSTDYTDNTSNDVQDNEQASSSSETHDGIQLPGDPIVLLVARGNCPFTQKALKAQSIDPQIMFLAVYNTDDLGDDALIPMSGDTIFGSGILEGDASSLTRLVLFSVSHATGQAIKHYIANQTIDVLQDGGPRVELDSKYPYDKQSASSSSSSSLSPEVIDMNDLTAMLISALGFLFVMMSLIGCIIIFVATYGQIRFVTNNGRLVVVMTTAANSTSSNTSPASATTPVFEQGGMAGTDPLGTSTLNASTSNTTTAPAASTVSVFNFIAGNPRRLLSMDEVYQLQQQQQQHNSADSNDTSSTAYHSTDALHPDYRQRPTAVALMDSRHDEGEAVTPATNDDDDDENYDNCCAICLEDLSNIPIHDILKLPCSHSFHYRNCIVPWLTERQSKCPLCKYDVYEYIRTNQSNTTTNNSSSVTTSDSGGDGTIHGSSDGIFTAEGRLGFNSPTSHARSSSSNLWNQLRSTISGSLIYSSLTPVSTNVVQNDINTTNNNNRSHQGDDGSNQISTTNTPSISTEGQQQGHIHSIHINQHPNGYSRTIINDNDDRVYNEDDDNDDVELTITSSRLFQNR